MNDDWTPMEFTCKDWKGSFILDGEAIELIQALLDDHIIKTQTMKGSPYAKVFLDQIT
jgi:dynein heavy chain, axonemal